MEAQDLARAQKKCSAERRLIVFIDESGLSERPTRVRTWAPKGCTPVVQFHFNWKHVSAVAGLTRSNFLFRLYDGAVRSAQIVEFLKALRAQLKRKLLIVWDGAAQHKSSIVRELPRQHQGRSPDGAVAGLLAGPQPGRIPVGLAQAARSREFLSAARWPNSRPQRETSCAAVSAASRSSPHAGSKPSCGDVMAYVKLNNRSVHDADRAL